MRPLPQVLQHGANSIWKSCSQYFRPSSCKRGQQTEDKEGTVIPRAALARLLGEDLPSGTLDKHPTLCTCYHHRKLGGGGAVWGGIPDSELPVQGLEMERDWPVRLGESAKRGASKKPATQQGQPRKGPRLLAEDLSPAGLRNELRAGGGTSG